MRGHRKYLLGAIAVVGILHFCLSWVAFTKSELIKPTEATGMWKSVTRVLAFPLVYLGDAASGIDLFPILMIANSLLWGVVIVLLGRWCFRGFR